MSLKRKSAFTLIELLVVVFIMGILATVMISNFRAGEKQKRVQLGADTVISGMRTLQSIVQSGKQIPNCVPKPTYFAAVSNNGTTVTLYCSSLVFQTFNLPAEVQVKSSGITVNGNQVTGGVLIYLYPPFADMKVCTAPVGPVCNGTISSFENTNIILESNDQKFSRTITVDSISGRIQ